VCLVVSAGFYQTAIFAIGHFLCISVNRVFTKSAACPLGYNSPMPSEFDLIARYFTRPARSGGPVLLGVGDDGALLAPIPGETLAISTDMLVEARHFFAGADPEALGHKALAVNLSDLAAMGARPLAFTLALALPAADEAWLEKFSRALFSLADTHAIELIGGDTTRGPLNICITVFGSVPAQQALRRDGAVAGDDVWVSGALGDARLALEALQRNLSLSPAALQAAALRLHRPEPRVALGLALRGIASAAIDLSDGLLGDLGHLLERSSLGAVIDADALPFGETLASQPLAIRRELALNGGDDYELCFTAAPALRDRVQAAARQSGVAVTRIGYITADPSLRVTDAGGDAVAVTSRSFDHFGNP
jgi:thiamine-monophosphate kinase